VVLQIRILAREEELLKVKNYTFYDTSQKALWTGVVQLIQRIATGWTVLESNPGGGEILRTCPDLPWGPPSLLYKGYRAFLSGKPAGAWR
jgi:hypothetical protein